MSPEPKRAYARVVDAGSGIRGGIMTQAQLLRNPGNLRYARQREAIGESEGFAKFQSDPAGWRALVNQIKLDAKRGHTLETFIAKYAPPIENETEKYLDFVCAALDAKPARRIGNFHPAAIAGAIAWYEGYFVKE
jgi:hypothetical protein